MPSRSPGWLAAASAAPCSLLLLAPAALPLVLAAAAGSAFAAALKADGLAGACLLCNQTGRTGSDVPGDVVQHGSSTGVHVITDTLSVTHAAAEGGKGS